MSNIGPEPHVAQQIRRDRLRIQSSSRHLEQDSPSSLEQLSLRPAGISSDLEVKSTVRNANMLYEPVLYSSSEMVNFSTDSNHLAEFSSRLMTTMPQFASFPYSSNPASSSFHTSLEEQCEVRNFGYWMPNESNPNPDSIFGVEINNELTGVQSCSLNNPSWEMATRESQRLLGNIHPNVMQGSSEMTSLTQQTGRGMWVGNGNQLFFLPNKGIQSNQLRLGNPNSCTNRTMGCSLGCEASDEYSGRRVSESNNQGLSLSLSSNSQSAPCRSSDDHQSRRVLSKDPQYTKPLRSVATLSSNAGDRVKSLQNMVVGIPSSNIDYRNVGPLGPFTGYATILKDSSFLKPAQELLEEICGQSNENLTKGPYVSGRVSGEVGSSISADAVNPTIECGFSVKNSSSGGSFSMLHCSNGNEISGDGETRSSSRPSSRPEYQQIMARFLYMQEEVIRRYKQHQQQMQIVIPSFESVTGLSSATPYISKALKSVSRHFRYLENAISDQVKHIRELGEELSASTSGCGVTSTSGKLDSNIARLKFLDQSFQKNKYVLGGTSYVEQQQPAWRPQQKGLPERAVSVLRAWLFDHFLHPYPTDSDKHMLAARTGLSRNQVSNWFINARVRVWKPMVEEIHMLETKGLTSKKDDAGNGGKNEGSGAIEGGHQPELQEEEVVELNAKEWNQEKRSKLECQMEGTLMGFVPYRRGEVEVGGVGPVSLTLALKHGDVEAIQQHHRHQLRRARHQ